MNKTLPNMVQLMMFFKNEKLMFWDDALYLRNISHTHVLNNKAPYEMWHGHIPSAKHLRVFGSTCYDLIPKEQRNKLGAKSQKCIFLGYSNTSKAYHLYDEINKKFILSRNVIFLESSKDDKIVERQLDHLDRFTHWETYSKCDNEIPHLEGGSLSSINLLNLPLNHHLPLMNKFPPLH